MKITIFSKKLGISTDSPLWPLNQRTSSEFVVGTDSKVVEIVHCGEDCVFINRELDQFDFEVTFTNES